MVRQLTLKQARLFVDTIRYLEDVEGSEELARDIMGSPWLENRETTTAELQMARRALDDRFYLPRKLKPSLK
jgi:hypothetical protein